MSVWSEVVALVQCTHCSDRVCAWSSRALVTALRVGRLAGAAINLLEVDDMCATTAYSWPPSCPLVWDSHSMKQLKYCAHEKLSEGT